MFDCISALSQRHLVVRVGGPYIVLAGNAVTVECTVKDTNIIPPGSTVSLTREQSSDKVINIATFTVFGNLTQIHYGLIDVILNIHRNSFNFTFNTTLADTADYHCYCQIYPLNGVSNKTKITVQGNIYRYFKNRSMCIMIANHKCFNLISLDNVILLSLFYK